MNVTVNEGVNAMNARNRITLDAIEGMEIAEIAKLHPSELSLLIEDADALAAKAKKVKDWLAGALYLRYSATAMAMRAATNKLTGIVHLDDDGFDIEVDAPKKVKWDQDKLSQAFDAMNEELARHYCKAKLEVDERKYAAAPPDIQKLMEPARTVEVGKPTFKISPKKDA